MGQVFAEICETDGLSTWPDPPWEKTSQLPIEWMSQNIRRFIFSPQQIIESFSEYTRLAPPNDSGIYFLGLQQDIGYVGKATNVLRRLEAHKRNGKQFSHFWCMTGVPQMFIEDIEAFYIQWLEPPLNEKRGRFDSIFDDVFQECKAKHPWPPEEFLH